MIRVFKFTYTHERSVIVGVFHLVQVSSSLQHHFKAPTVLYHESEAAFVSPATFARVELDSKLLGCVNKRVSRSCVLQ